MLDYSKIADAYGLFKRYSGLQDSTNQIPSFWEFLGFKNRRCPINGSEDEDVIAKMNHKVEWLTGPHGETLFKAWRLKQGKTNDKYPPLPR